MLDINKWEQYGFPREASDVQGICVHETGNDNMNAQELFDYLNDENKTSQGCHYLIDSNEIIEVMPHNYAVYHTGKGLDWGNRYTIAIEVCSNINDEAFTQAKNKAIGLIKSLQDQYNISNDNVFFHIDFNEKTYCPKTLLNLYGSSRRFVIEELEEN